MDKMNHICKAEEFIENPNTNIAKELQTRALQKHDLIAEVAYSKAEKRRFSPGYEMQDWLEAEREIEEKLSVIEK